MDRYDVVVVGGGWGGFTAAVRTAQLGKSVALIERDRLGGTCLNRGCIPTKVLIETADLLARARHAADLGVSVGDVGLDFDRVRARMDEVVGQLRKGVETLVKTNKVTLLSGDARVESPSRVTVRGADGVQELEAGDVIIATGSRPKMLPRLDVDSPRILDSDALLRITRVPSSIIVLGAGAVGAEFASLLADYGSRVTLVEMLPRVLPLEDADCSQVVDRAFRKRGIEVLTGAAFRTESIELTEGGLACVVEKDGEQRQLTAESLLVAVGRDAVLDGFDAARLGLKVERGVVVVDERMRTSVPHLYAVGDVNGGLQLAHVAAAEGTLAAETIAGNDDSPLLPFERLPRGTYTRPQVGSVGLTEQQAKERGLAVRTGRAHFRANGRALIRGEVDGFVKVVADADRGDVLGIHVVGPEATELVAEGALARFLDAAVWELAASVHPHPTLAEALGEAATAASRSPTRL